MPNNNKLDEVLRLAKENNRLLHKIRRSALLSNIFKVLIYAVALGVPIYLYFTILQPMFGSLAGIESAFKGSVSNFQDLFSGGNTEAIKNLINLAGGK